MAVWKIKERNELVREGKGQGHQALISSVGATNGIDKFSVISPGNTTDFGDLTRDTNGGNDAGGSNTRAVFLGGQNPTSDTIDYVTFRSDGNAADFGNLTDARGTLNGNGSSQTRILVGGGDDGPSNVNIIDFVQIQHTGNATDFGDLTAARNTSSISNGVRCLFYAGGPFSNVIDFVNIATAGNATDFGDATASKRSGTGGIASATRGVFTGGVSPGSSELTTIEFVNFATTGNGTDYGDTHTGLQNASGAANGVRGFNIGGQAPSNQTRMDFWNIDSTATVSDFGDATSGGTMGGSTCEAHAGVREFQDIIQRPSVTYMPGSGRGIAMGGYNSPAPKSTIELIHIPTLGNSSDFGDMHTAMSFGSANSSLTRTIMQGGYNNALTTEVDQIQYIEHASQGNGADFGNLLSTRANSTSTGSCSSTRGLSEGGGAGGSGVVNEIEFITMTTLGNGTDFGDLTQAREVPASCSSPTRGVTGGGAAPGASNVMDYVTIASTGNSTDFGDLTEARARNGALSSSTRGIFSGGDPGPSLANIIDYITIASTGNAQDFGDLLNGQTGPNGMSNNTRGVFVGGRISPANINVLQSITIASTGNAADFGDLSEVKEGIMCGSDSHGGLPG